MRHEYINYLITALADPNNGIKLTSASDKDKATIDELNNLVNNYINCELKTEILEDFGFYIDSRYKDRAIHRIIRKHDKDTFICYVNLRGDNLLEYYYKILDLVIDILNQELDKRYGVSYHPEDIESEEKF